MSSRSFFAGLRSGQMFSLTREDPKAPGDPAPLIADVTHVTVEDIAQGLSVLNRWNGAFWRQPYTEAEHAVLLSYLVANGELDGLDWSEQALWHSAPKALGFGDVNHQALDIFGAGLRRAAGVTMEALAKKFQVTFPFAREVVAADRLLGNYEWARLHPAKTALGEAWGQKPADQYAAATPVQRNLLDGWFARNPISQDHARQLWLGRVKEIDQARRVKKHVRDGVAAILARPGLLPQPVGLLGPKIAEELRVATGVIQAELKRYEALGLLTIHDNYYHQA